MNEEILQRNQSIEFGKELSVILTNLGYNCSKEKIQIYVDCIYRYTHRAIHDSITRLCIQWIVNMSEKTNNNSDVRNSLSVSICKCIVEKNKDTIYFC